MKPMFRLPLLLVLALLALPRAGAAQETPDAFAQAYFQTMKTGDWAANARLMHPEALQGFKDMVSPLLSLGTGEELARLMGVDSAATLAALPPADFFARFVGSVMAQQGLMEVMRSAEIQVVGSVPEGADQAHVVYRMSMSVAGATVTRMNVISARRDGASWKGLLTGDMQGLAQALQGLRQ